MKKLFKIAIKYIPIIQMVGIIISNTLYYTDIYTISYILDFIIGNSLTNTALLYICSFVFGFCKWHRYIITANLCMIIISTIDSIYKINVTDLQLLIIYYIIASIFIILATISHIKGKDIC